MDGAIPSDANTKPREGLEGASLEGYIFPKIMRLFFS
jgi:hypothetical protein